jgi:hypothetical protein
MIGKIVTIGIVGLLAAVLIAGSAYIVLRPGEAQAQRESGGRGQSGQAYAPEPGGGKGYGAENTSGRGAGGGDGKRNGAPVPSSNGTGRGSGSGVSSAAYPATEWLTLGGEVIARVDDELTVQTADGEMVLHLGPEWYWDAEGIPLNAGDQVQVTGFYDADEFEVARVENTTSGESVTLRDDSGRPLWAGRGRQGR